MSEQTETVVYDFDMADRLRKSVRHTDLSVEELAEELGYSRQSVSAWTSGRSTPRRSVLLAWSMRTGYDVGWLETGAAPAGRPDGGPVTADTSRGQVIDGTGWFNGTSARGARVDEAA